MGHFKIKFAPLTPILFTLGCQFASLNINLQHLYESDAPKIITFGEFVLLAFMLINLTGQPNLAGQILFKVMSALAFRQKRFLKFISYSLGFHSSC